MATTDPEALLRALLILLHVLAFALAAVGTAFCDYAVLFKYRLDVVLMHRAARVVTAALGALWLSGLGIVWVDTGLDLQVMADRPKLLAKLSVVAALTLNGLLLHRLVFPLLLTANRGGGMYSRLPALLGGVSAASWLFAAFVGVAKPLETGLGYAGFMALYGVVLLVAASVALTWVQRRLLARLNVPVGCRASAPGASVWAPSHSPAWR